jgi:cytochrome c biogenesis protein CcmG, thiol:disulfide interchange protein DsbE
VDQQKKRQPTWLMLIVCLALIGLVIFMISALVNHHSTKLTIGDQVSPLKLTTFDGEDINTADLDGKVIVVNFWASWCNTCSIEAPMLEQAWERYRNLETVVFLGVAYKDKVPEAINFLSRYNILYDNALDQNYRLAQALQLQGIPETYIIDQYGRLAYKKLGPFPSLESIISAIDPLLK